jgi:hypothetical protein
MNTWRQHSFKQGHSYKVKVSFSTATSKFDEGEMVVYIDSSYSPYDGSTGFMFQTDGLGQMKTWFLRDDEIDNSLELFE